MGFAREAMRNTACENIIEGNFLRLPSSMPLEELLSLRIPQRDEIETIEATRLAELVVRRLPRDEETLARRLADGCALAKRMSWQRVVKDYFLPSLDRAAHERQDT